MCWDNTGEEFCATKKVEKCRAMAFLFTAGLLDYTESVNVAPTCVL